MYKSNLQNVKVTKKKCEKKVKSRESLMKMSQEELVEKILKLEAHNEQLQSILKKKSLSLSKEESKTQKNFDFRMVSKRHVFLKFFYFGWDYNGYVVQEDTDNTIEDYIFQALKKCCLIEGRENSNYHRCGRTDKGVSAFSQVISIDLRSKLSDPNENNVDQEFPYCLILNRVLPDNIKFYAWCHVQQTASSRFDCSLRTYKYYFPKGDLDIQIMQEAAKYLVGTHDFRNFCRMDVGNGIVNFQKKIQSVDIKKCNINVENMPGYEMYEFKICGNSFLWHQIRCIMSLLLLVGKHQEEPEIIKHLLDVGENPTKPQYSMASHLPLNLYSVEYDNLQAKWIVDEDNIIKILKSLQRQWALNAVKNVMIRDFINNINELKNGSESSINKQAEFLSSGAKSKTHKPLLTRLKCESLESKIDYYVKKKKLEIVTEETKPS